MKSSLGYSVANLVFAYLAVINICKKFFKTNTGYDRGLKGSKC